MNQLPVIHVHTFDLFRLTRSKEVVDLDPDTIREYSKQGLNLYTPKGGRAVFVSKAELEAFIKQHPIAH
jgi:hypothetical protein